MQKIEIEHENFFGSGFDPVFQIEEKGSAPVIS
jgi:hypothetical protein